MTYQHAKAKMSELSEEAARYIEFNDALRTKLAEKTQRNLTLSRQLTEVTKQRDLLLVSLEAAVIVLADDAKETVKHFQSLIDSIKV